jgi:peroxiredoxin 2/4
VGRSGGISRGGMDRDCCGQESQVSLPRLNEPAPQFTAVTSQGPKSLSDYKGRWVILFSHPADFTPVCTTEFVAFSRIYPQLQQRNVDLIGLSIDSNFSHIAWLRNVEQHFEDVKIQFPVIADIDMKVAHLYGMVHPGASSTQAVRAVFIIDDKQVLRAMLYYPMNVGRNMDEIIRLVDGLQTADREKVACPANWRPGDKVVVPPPATVEAAAERVKAGYECVDWYLCLRNL